MYRTTIARTYQEYPTQEPTLLILREQSTATGWQLRSIAVALAIAGPVNIDPTDAGAHGFRFLNYHLLHRDSVPDEPDTMWHTVTDAVSVPLSSEQKESLINKRVEELTSPKKWDVPAWVLDRVHGSKPEDWRLVDNCWINDMAGVKLGPIDDFLPCPKCHRWGNVILSYDWPTEHDEFKCGSCQTVIGRSPTPKMVVGTSYIRAEWNRLVRDYQGPVMFSGSRGGGKSNEHRRQTHEDIRKACGVTYTDEELNPDLPERPPSVIREGRSGIIHDEPGLSPIITFEEDGKSKITRRWSPEPIEGFVADPEGGYVEPDSVLRKRKPEEEVKRPFGF